MNEMDIKLTTLAETDNMSAWKAEEPDGEATYNLQVNNVTVNFFQEEWDEFIILISKLGDKIELVETDNMAVWKDTEPGVGVTYFLELINVAIQLFDEDWVEFLSLVKALK